MSKPESEEVGVLLTLAVMGGFALLMLIVMIGTLWPKIQTFFDYLS